MLAWQVLRATMQATWGIGLARVVGPEQYGLFAGFAGLASTLGALTGVGFGLLMLQNASRQPERFANYWNAALAAAGVSAALLATTYFCLASIFTGEKVSLFFLVAVGIPELVCLPLIVICSYAFQANERMGWAGALYAIAPLGNLLALVAFLALDDNQTISAYLPWHMGISLTATMLSLAVVYLLISPRKKMPELNTEDRNSAPSFAAMQMADTALASLDKTLVLRIAGSEFAGQYTAAYRLATVVALPVVSLALSVTPRLFRRRHGTAAEDRLERKQLFGVATGIGFVTVPLMWILSFMLPWLLGTQFEPAAALSRQLLLLPALLGLSALGCSVLMTDGQRGTRVMVQTGAVAGLLLLIPWLIENHHSNGAAWAVQIVYAALVVAIWWIIRRERGLR